MDVRTATIMDIDAIAPLYRVLFAEMARLQPGVWRPAEMSRSFLVELIEGERSDILVAVDEAVIGFAVLQDRDTPGFSCIIPNRYAYLMDMCVAPEHRGKGAGSALLAAAEGWAAKRGAAWLELNVLEENEDAVRLYRRSGLCFSQHTMRKALAPDNILKGDCL